MKKILLCCLLSLLCAGYVQAQDRNVTGKVTDGVDGSPLPGVNVVVKGTQTGTTTDAGGAYSIEAPANATLVFSFIGMVSQEVAVGSQTNLDVRMTADMRQLNEVVVTALGIEQQRRSLGTSVTEVKASQIQDTRQTNVVNSLAGKVAGVRIQASNGMVGASSSIFIRGFTSFNSSNQPLFVVDGIPIDNSGGTNELQQGVSNSNRAIDINPDDVESMSVLKGPAAAVLYGSRAAAGAILITTKKGKNNTKNTISITSNYNVVEVNRTPDYQNEYGQGASGNFNRLSLDSWGPRIAGQTVKNFLNEDEQLAAYPNNVRDLLKKGFNFQNSISFSGGNDKTNFLLSYSNTAEEGILRNNRLDRNTFKVTVNSNLTSKLSAGASINYFNTATQRTQIGNQTSSPFFRTWFLPRSFNLANYPVTDADGNQQYFDAATDNPLWSIDNILNKDRVDRLLGYVNLNYKINDLLNVSYKIGTDAYLQNTNGFDPSGLRGNGNYGYPGDGAVGNGNFYSQQTSSYLNLSFKKEFSETFGISALVGNEVNVIYARDQGVVGSPVQVPGFNQITNTTVYQPFSTVTRSRLIGLYAQVEGHYKDFLYLTLTGRNDWSSTFVANNRSYFYPSAAASFVFSQAIPSLRESSVLTFGKLRANIAQVGRQAPVYATDTYFSVANPANGYGPNLQFPFRGLQAYSLNNNAGNPNLRPEFTVTREVGTELRFFNNRLNLDLGYFSTRSTDIIINAAVAAPVSVASGFSDITRNAGELKSNGIELLLGGTAVKTNSFSWDVSLNFTRIRTEVVRIDPLVTSIFLGGFTTPQAQLKAGQPYGVLVGNYFNRDASGNLLIGATGLTSTNTSDVKVIGDPNPDWTAGITNTFNYRGISLSVLFDIRQGGDLLSRNIRDIRFRGAGAETGNRDEKVVIAGVKRDPVNAPDGTPRALLVDGQPVTNAVEITKQQYYQNYYQFQGESMVFDGSWIRLREASISYSLPKSLLSKSFFGAVQVALTGRNLWLRAPNYPHLDPETNAQGVSNSQGIEFNGLPQTRTYGALIRLSF